jgi:hypothetical protein
MGFVVQLGSSVTLHYGSNPLRSETELVAVVGSTVFVGWLVGCGVDMATRQLVPYNQRRQL